MVRCGTKKEVTLLEFSAFFIDILSGRFDINLPMGHLFVPGGRNRRQGYFLADGIYREWPIFVRPIHDAPAGPKKDYTMAHEGFRKDIESIFSFLQGRFLVLRRESELWNVEKVVSVSELCVILHNLLVGMQKSGAFEEELEEEDVKIDLIEQFILEEACRLHE